MKKIEIAYDYQIFIRQHMGGISRVFYEVNSRIEGRPDILLKYPVKHSQNYYFRDRIHSSELSSKSRMMNYGVRLYNKVLFILFLIANRNCDIVHATYYSSYFYYFLSPKTKYVLTVHDCTQELYSKNSVGNARMCYLKKKAIYRANAIIVPSENTKKDIIKLYHIDETKIHVINWGMDQVLIDMKKIDIKLPGKYILYVGARNDYKNFKNFILAAEGICRDYKEIRIVCLGGGVFSKTEEKEMKQLGVYDYFLQVSANDDELMYAYKNAICFVYPSYYEGFGIPIIEAYENECPVALSNASCFPEVAGDAALYFDPHDAIDMKETIIKLIKDENLRKCLVKKGKERLKQFSWNTTAEAVAKLYFNMATEK